MTLAQSVEIPLYTMPLEMDNAYSRVHTWLDNSPKHRAYRKCNWNSDKAAAVTKASPEHAAFYFDSLFPTHFFKAYHTLRSEETGVRDQLLQWLRFNPNLAVLDLGCGDGAGSCAIIATLFDLRLRELLDPRPLRIHIIAVDVDSFGLEIYQEVVSALAAEVSSSGIHVSFEVLLQRLNDAGSEVESQLNSLRKSWGHPYLARLISIESNLNDYLVREQYRTLSPIPCTDCKYCQPCPNNVAIPRIFDLYNMAIMYNAGDRARRGYEQWLREEERANCCLECGECETKCPQGIEIIEWLGKADEYLSVH